MTMIPKDHNKDVIDEDDGTAVAKVNESHMISRGHTFRKLSLKVIEWIRKSLELGRNEVCDMFMSLFKYIFCCLIPRPLPFV